MIVVGLLGKKGSGKSTVARYLIETRSFVEVSFAGRLKELAIELFDLRHEQVYGTIAEKETIDPRYNKTPREIMQHIGGSMREIHNGVWVDSPLASIKYDSVISDVRHINEAEAIRKKGGIVVKIVRPGFDTGAYNDHPSETEVDRCEYDHVLCNDGSLAALRHEVEELLGRLSRPDNAVDHTDDPELTAEELSELLQQKKKWTVAKTRILTPEQRSGGQTARLGPKKET